MNSEIKIPVGHKSRELSPGRIGDIASSPVFTQDRNSSDVVDVAIVHEWLTSMAGSEKVVEAICGSFGRYHIYTALLNEKAFPGWSENTTTSLLQKVPFFNQSQANALALLLPAMRLLRIRKRHDLIIRSFHTFALLPQAQEDVPEIVYCHTPPRFLYRRETMAHESPLLRGGMRLLNGSLQHIDQRSMSRNRTVVANSRHIQQKIKQIYHQDAEVIYPPVDVNKFQAGQRSTTDDYFIYFSRLVPYKRPDVAIEAFRDLPYRLLVIGEGRMRPQLEAVATPNVSFLGRVPDEELPTLLGSALGLVFPGEEDFGIAPVETMATGTPVIAYASGGALEYVNEETGMLVPSQTPRDFATAVRLSVQRDWNRMAISNTTLRFSRERFTQEIQTLAAETLGRIGR